MNSNLVIHATAATHANNEHTSMTKADKERQTSHHRSRSRSRSLSKSPSKRYRRRSRTRSRSRSSRHHRSYRRHEENDRRSSNRYHRGSRYDYSRSRSRSPSYSSHPYSPDSKRDQSYRRSPSPKLSEAERDRRTVFVQQLAAKLRERDLIEFMSKVGRVRDAKIVTDKKSGRSRGFGYVEFCKEESVPLAILMSGEKLMGIPILISYTETEKNRFAEEAAEIAKRSRASTQHYTKLQVTGLHPEMSQDKLLMLFEPFGPVQHVHLVRDSVSGKSKGIAYVHFKNYMDAKNALEQLNGLELAGFTMRIYSLSDKAGSSILDDAETQGMAMSAQSRTDLMMKLARDTDLIKQLPSAMNEQQSMQQTTPYILLLNMYDPDEEPDHADWEDELTEDVHEECSKFGKVVHLKVMKTKLGEVFLKYADMPSAQLAIATLNGRWFGGKQIQAYFISAMIYQNRCGVQ